MIGKSRIHKGCWGDAARDWQPRKCGVTEVKEREHFWEGNIDKTNEKTKKCILNLATRGSQVILVK